jgi:hypothetical protein
MAPSQIDLKALSESIADGIIRGNSGVVTGFTTESDRRHRLADAIQSNTDKVYQLDKEMVLVKGMLVALIGKDADGSSGLVPRMDSDMKELKTDVVIIKGEMREMKDDVASMAANIKVIMDSQGKTNSWLDGWRGVGFAIGFAATVIAVVGGIVSGLLWLYHNGSVITHSGMF